MMGPGWGMGWGMGGGIWMILALLVIIGVAVYYFTKNKNNNGLTNSQQDTKTDALEIARTRLAKGEITTEEFEEIKKTLL
ncbi:SHOCT domain-containing protein [Planococcus sp. S3-L1]|uniref:SHOCT domain-containing protein n=1 Tax=Planococcus sp. S3-L1 TaxID=3046200 RepID=UPI0024BA175E|nr:SHOCT domain-containing protein [Planococcus sp. S3-L1]MDJ0331552.1 SHOCT domain-containing protein [Planococcus sp. S3-L1]